MNIVFHFLFGLLMAELVFGNALAYLPYILVFSLLVDLDHIPYVLRFRRGLMEKKFGSESRSRFHELYGMTVLSIAISAASFFINPKLAGIIALSVILHYAVDFVAGNTRPFYPLSGTEVNVGLYPKKFRIVTEAILTAVLVIILWLAM
jgi:membrane-bound metal-dependent hydrolase YbcI (DUF457 family)